MKEQQQTAQQTVARETGSPTRPAHGAPPVSTTGAVAPTKWIHRLLATARQFFVFCARERLWTAMMLVFIATWTAELYTLQAETLVYPNVTTDKYKTWAPLIRGTLDLLLISAVTMALRRRWLVLAAFASFFVYLILLTYFNYFLRPLSLLTIVTSWREGMEVGGFAWDMFPRGAAALLFLALVVKLTALVQSRRVSLPRPCAWLAAGVLLSGYVGLYATANYLDPLSYIQTTRGVGRLGHIRGYLGPWFAEWYYLGHGQLLDEVLEQRRKVYDRVTPIEAEIPIHDRLVIIQAESLDTNILGFRADGVEVTPFLNQLRDKSMFYRVRALHWQGSCDADFAALNGVAGSARVNTYIVPDYPYENTTPQMLAECGFKTFSFHGNSGEFYSRRQAYEKMGFEDIIFQEEMERDYNLKSNDSGVFDADTLNLSAEMLARSKTPTCHFIITLTTHTPYTRLPPDAPKLFPDANTTSHRYFNNMRYLDNCLRDYITSLGEGVTVLIYADHSTQDFEGFVCDRDVKREMEFVPCLIYDTDRDLSKLQKTRNQPIATDGTLNLVDVINYVRGQAKRTFEKRITEEPAQPANTETP